MMDKIAVLLACYNGEKYLDEQLKSLEEQTFKDFFIYVHDDGSADRTMEILHKWQNKFNEKMIILDGPPSGSSKANFMFLLRNVEADYYLLCDQDDFWLSDKIEKSLAYIPEKKDPEIPLLVHSELEVVDQNLNIISKKMSDFQHLNVEEESLCHLLVQNSITGCTMMINRSLRDLSLKISNIDNIIMHDWFFGLVAAQYGKIVFIKDATIKYRQHAGNVLGAVSYKSIRHFFHKITQIKEAKMMFQKTWKQAEEFVSCFNPDKNSLIYQYAYIGRKNKIRRLTFYLKNRTLKCGFWRIVSQILLG